MHILAEVLVEREILHPIARSWTSRILLEFDIDGLSLRIRPVATLRICGAAKVIPEDEKHRAGLALKQVLFFPVKASVSDPAATVVLPRAGLVHMVARELQAADHVGGNTQSRAAPHKVLAVGNQSIVENLVSLSGNQKDRLAVRVDVVELADVAVDDEVVFTFPIEAASVVLTG